MPDNSIKIRFKKGRLTISPSDYTVRLRRGTRTEMESIVFALDEFVYMTDIEAYFRGDGVTPGGVFFAND